MGTVHNDSLHRLVGTPTTGGVFNFLFCIIPTKETQ